MLWTIKSRGLSVDVGQASARRGLRAGRWEIACSIAIGSGYDRKAALADRWAGQVARLALGLGGWCTRTSRPAITHKT